MRMHWTKTNLMTTTVAEFTALCSNQCTTFRAEHIAYKSTHFAKCEVYSVNDRSA